MKGFRDRNSQEESVEDKSKEEAEGEAAEEVEESQSSDQDISKMQAEFEVARSENEAAADMMLRLAAEMDNYKKRVEKERQSLIKYGCQGVVQELLVSRDVHETDLESALFEMSEAQVDGDAAFLFLSPTIAVDARQRFDELRLAVVDVAGGADDDPAPSPGGLTHAGRGSHGRCG